jgi:hypothetical protein
VMDDKLDRLFEGGDDLADDVGPVPRKPRRKASSKRKNFAIVPLNDDWGYRAVTAAKEGAAIVLYVLREQRAREYRSDGIPITAAMLRRFGISLRVRNATIDRLVAAGFATVRRRGKHRGCPLLTLNVPAEE